MTFVFNLIIKPAEAMTNELQPALCIQWAKNALIYALLFQRVSKIRVRIRFVTLAVGDGQAEVGFVFGNAERGLGYSLSVVCGFDLTAARTGQEADISSRGGFYRDLSVPPDERFDSGTAVCARARYGVESAALER